MICLVTGVSDGLGMGYYFLQSLINIDRVKKVYFTARKENDVTSIIKSLKKDNNNNNNNVDVIGFVVDDLIDEERCRVISKYVSERESVLDVLINNAGLTSGKDDISNDNEGKQQTWNKVVGVNMFVPFFLTLQLLPLLRKSDNARVINVSTISSVTVPVYDMIAYSSAKAGLNHITRMMAAKLASDKILVNAILAGPFLSRRMKQESLDAIEGTIPLGRVGKQKDIQHLIIYLINQEWTTGVCYPLEGGLLLKL